jgi:hypothetical protein
LPTKVSDAAYPFSGRVREFALSNFHHPVLVDIEAFIGWYKNSNKN